MTTGGVDVEDVEEADEAMVMATETRVRQPRTRAIRRERRGRKVTRYGLSAGVLVETVKSRKQLQQFWN